MKVLLVEPDYYSRYPPLGLLRIGKMEERGWNDVIFVRGTQYTKGFEPRKTMVTSLFTFMGTRAQCHCLYHEVVPDAEIVVGGIYATLMPGHVKNAFPYVRIHSGLIPEAEGVLPAYLFLKQEDKWKNWKKSIVFTTRRCIRKCPFCVVPKIEGKMKEPKFSTLPLIHPSHNEVVIWDNNFLASYTIAKLITGILRMLE